MKRISKNIIKRIMTFVLTIAMVLGAIPLPQFTMVARAETATSPITVDSTDYTLFTGFTATAGTAGTFGYTNFVDGNTSTKWWVSKNYDYPNAPVNDFAGGEDDPAFVEFHADAPFIPKGYILTYDNSVNESWKPTSWALKAKQNESDEWTTIHSSNSSLDNGSRFEIACNNDGDNMYQYFRFEIYDVGSTYQSILNELEFYGNTGFIHLTPKDATCTETGIKQECWYSNGKYFSDANGTTELDESAVVEPMKAHTCVHHEASATNTEYWQCSACGKYFSDESCTNEISEAEALIGVFSALAGGCYTLASQTYTLTDDVNTAGYIYVPEGVTATIDLNGHTIDRGLTSADNNGSVIIVAGTLTITDSGTDGKIQGGYDGYAEHGFYVSGVEVQNGATFNLQGGTLVGRNQDYDCTVAVDDNGSFTMTGGKITGGWTGVLAFGNVTLTGGEISGNNNSGVRVSENISISGNPVITGNTVMNVDLRSSGGICKINITGALTDGANIGITVHNPTDNSPVTVTSGYNTYNSVSPDTYFSLDNDGQIQTSPIDYMTVVMGWNEDRTEIAVGTASRTVNFDLQGHGSNIEAVSLLNGYKLIEPTEPTAEGWSFGGWYTDANCTDDSEWSFNSGVTSDMTLYALWTQGQTYRVTLPENMLLVSADNEVVGGKYPTGTNIRFKVKSADYVVDGDVKNGEDVLTADGNGIYTVTVGNADITITATVKKAVEANKELSGSESYTAQNGDVLTGSTSGTVTIPDGESITLSDVNITGGIVCNGTATITLVGTNSVSGATDKAGIQIGGSGTTLTIKGNGSLTANGGSQSAGIGLSRAWDPANDVIGGDIVIEGGNITANGGSQWGAGIGTGVIYGNGSAKTVRIGNITIKGGTVKATGGSDSDGIGTGYTYYGCTNAIGTVTIYDGIDMVDASSIKNSGSIVYKHEENDVTASTSDYFTIIENGNRRIIVQKVNPTIADIPDQTYTGSEITPKPLVLAGSLNLTKGTDYEYSYTDNTNVGTAKVTVTFKGDYESLGSVEKEFHILCKTVSDPTIEVAEATYTGNVLAPTVTVKDGDIVISSEEYTVSYTNNTNAALSTDANPPTVTITDKEGGSYIVSGSTTFTINPKPVTITGLSAENKEYDGTTAAATTGGTIDGKVDDADVSFTAGNASFDNANAGNGKTVTFSGYALSGEAAGNYTLSSQPANVTANIAAKSITIKAKDQSVELNDEIATGADKVEVSSGALVSGQNISEVTVSTSNARTATGEFADAITVSGAKIVSGSTDVTANYAITYAPGKLTVTKVKAKVKAKVTTAPTANNRTYDGTAADLLTGGIADTLLEYSTDGTNYSATVPQGTNAGTYTVYYRAAANENYDAGDAVEMTVTINKATQTITASNVAVTYGDTEGSVSASVTDPATDSGTISYAVKDGSGDYIDVNANTGALTIKKAGTATIIVTAAGTANYAQATKEVTVTIAKANIGTPTLSIHDKTYDGSEITYTIDGNPGSGQVTSLSWEKKNSNETWSTFDDTPKDAGTYRGTAVIAETENYNGATTNTAEFTISKANSVAATVTANNRTYDGTDKSLVTVTGEAKGGEMQYYSARLDDPANPPTEPTDESAYTTSIPTATNAGTYYVWYKVIGDANHIDVAAAGPLTIVIEKADFANKTVSANTKYGLSGTIELKDHIAPGGTAGELSVADTNGVLEGAPVLTGTVLSYSFKNEAENVGKAATVTIPVTNAANYNDYSITVTLNVINCEHSHTKLINVREATCTDTGYTGDTYCTDCNSVIATGNIIPINPDNHTYDSGVVTRQPTIFEEGVKTYTCTCCHHTYTETVPKVDDGEDHSDLIEDITDEEGKTKAEVKTENKEDGSKETTVTVGGQEVEKTVTDAEGNETVETHIWIGGLKSSYTYTGSAIKPSFHVYDGTKKLSSGTDYSVSYKNNKNAGDTATIMISFKGNYKGTAQEKLSFSITPAVLGADVEATDVTTYATGKALRPVPVMKWASTGKSIDKKNFSFTYKDSADTVIDGIKEAGQYKVVITSKSGSFTGETEAAITVTGSKKLLLSGATVKLSPNKYTYTGDPIIPAKDSYTLKLNGKVLTEGTDYVVSVRNNIEPGKATIVFTAKDGNQEGYVGEKSAAFTISKGRALKDGDGFTYSYSESVPYAKGGAKPTVVVKDGDDTLKAGTDYTVSYSKNTKVTNGATAVITITGKGNYKGSVKKYFTITAQDIEKLKDGISVDDKTESKKGYKNPTVTITDLDGKKLKAGTDFAIVSDSYSGPDTNGVVTATVSGKGNYTGTASITYRYIKGAQQLGKVKVMKSFANKTYTGREVRLTNADLTGILYTGSKNSPVYLIPGTDFKVISYTNNTKTGTAKVTIQGIGVYGGTRTLSFKIVAKQGDYKGSLVGGEWTKVQ